MRLKLTTVVISSYRELVLRPMVDGHYHVDRTAGVHSTAHGPWPRRPRGSAYLHHRTQQQHQRRAYAAGRFAARLLILPTQRYNVRFSISGPSGPLCAASHIPTHRNDRNAPSSAPQAPVVFGDPTHLIPE